MHSAQSNAIRHGHQQWDVEHLLVVLLRPSPPGAISISSSACCESERLNWTADNRVQWKAGSVWRRVAFIVGSRKEERDFDDGGMAHSGRDDPV